MSHFTNVERIRLTVRGLRIRTPFSPLSDPNSSFLLTD